MRKAVFGAIVAGLLAAVAGGYWWTVARFVETTDNAYVQSDISVVSPRVQGYVREVLAADNQAVRAGQVLVRLEDRDFVAKVVEALARVQARRAALRAVNSQIARQRSVADQAAASLAGAEAEQRRSAQDYQRYQSLARADFASRQRLEAVLADARKAEAAVQRAHAALASENDQIAVLEAQRKEAEEFVAEAEAALDAARIDVEATLIRAPVDGVVGNRSVQVGQLVKPGTQLLAVVPLAAVYVVANFKETQLSRMRAGQSAVLEFDAFPGQTTTGTIDSFSPATGSLFSLLPPENATGNFVKVVQRLPVRISLPPGNPLEGLLRPGLSARVAVDTHDDGAGGAAFAAVATARASPAPGPR